MHAHLLQNIFGDASALVSLIRYVGSSMIGMVSRKHWDKATYSASMVLEEMHV